MLKARLQRVFKLLAGVVGVLVLAFATHYAARDDVLMLSELRLVGEFNQVKADELKALVAARIDGNFLTVDVKGVHAVVMSLPWIRTAYVDRIWPDVLQVRVVEEKPVARWNDEMLINAEGRPFVAALPTDWPNVPGFFGPPYGEKLMTQSAVSFADALAKTGLHVTSVNLDARHSWALKLSNGMELMLGREYAQQRLERFVQIYPVRFQATETQVERVDLRYTNGFAVKWRSGTEARPGADRKATV